MVIISEFLTAAGEGKFQSLNNFEVLAYVTLAIVPLASESHRGREKMEGHDCSNLPQFH